MLLNKHKIPRNKIPKSLFLSLQRCHSQQMIKLILLGQQQTDHKGNKKKGGNKIQKNAKDRRELPISTPQQKEIYGSCNRSKKYEGGGGGRDFLLLFYFSLLSVLDFWPNANAAARIQQDF